MSAVIVLAPVIVASWPAIAHVVTATVASMGFSILSGQSGQSQENGTNKSKANIDVPDSEILAEGTRDGTSMVLGRDGVSARLYRDERGAMRMCVEGDHDKATLTRIGEELLGAITQQYVYHRVRSELAARGIDVLEESVAVDRTVKLRVRAW